MLDMQVIRRAEQSTSPCQSAENEPAADPCYRKLRSSWLQRGLRTKTPHTMGSMFNIGDGDRLAPFFAHDRVRALDVCPDSATMLVEGEQFQPGSASMQTSFWVGVLLITHGSRDWHVPISDTLTFWNDLRHLGKDAKFLHFPTEGHGITRPANIQLWYQTVFTFLDATLHGKRWVKPRQL